MPSGKPDGGQWTDEEDGSGRLAQQPMGDIGITDRRVVSDADPEDVKPGAQYVQVGSNVKDLDGLPYYARGGHHEMPKGVYEKWDLQPETRKVFNDPTTGSVPTGKKAETPFGPIRGHYWDGKGEEHEKYNKAAVFTGFLGEGNEARVTSPTLSLIRLKNNANSTNGRLLASV